MPSSNNSYMPKCQPPHPTKSKNQAHLEIGSYEQMVTHVEEELELYGSLAPDRLQEKTMSQNAANKKADRPKRTCHHC